MSFLGGAERANPKGEVGLFILYIYVNSTISESFQSQEIIPKTITHAHPVNKLHFGIKEKNRKHIL